MARMAIATSITERYLQQQGRDDLRRHFADSHVMQAGYALASARQALRCELPAYDPANGRNDKKSFDTDTL